MTTPHMRAGHTDRQDAVDRLTRHFTEGRLDPTEFDERVAKAYAATHLDQLPVLLEDLPEDQQRRVDRAPTPWNGPQRPQVRRPPPVLAIILVVALLMSIGAITHGFFPFPLFWVVLVIFFIMSGRRRRYGSYHHGHNRYGQDGRR
jgi:hypothetical protein